MWSPEAYQQAILFAGLAHAGQYLPNTQASYLVHLANVAMEILNAWQRTSQETSADGSSSDWDVNLAMQCALLHDSLEDTATRYDELAAHFGTAVAQGVQALTKNADLPKTERMADSLARIVQQPPEIAMVKLADRITNLQKPPIHWDTAKIASYQQEARQILGALGQASPFLAQRLAAKIEAYTQYLTP